MQAQMTKALTFTSRRKVIVARTGALVLDSLLLAYTLWAVDFVAIHFGLWQGFLARMPLLLLLAPVVACAWQATFGSLGQRGYIIHLVGPDGAPASGDRRAFAALLTAVQVLLIVTPGLLLGVDAGVPIAVGLSVIAGALSMAHPRACSLAERLCGAATSRDPIHSTAPIEAWYRRPNAWIIIAILAVTFTTGGIITEFDIGALTSGAGRTGNLWAKLFSPDWSITGEVIERMVETVFLALMASAMALPFAFSISFLGARNLMTGAASRRLVYFLTRVLINVIRSIEPLVWAIIFVLWVGVGPFAGMLALFVHSVAALGKLYSEAVESIDPGPVEALQATGASPLQVVRFAIVPQVIPPFLSFTVYRWDINVRMATILGLVGGGGIGDLLINYQQLGAWAKVGTIIVFVTLVVWIMDLASAKARERLV